jgi:hypothetical protein
MAKEQESFEEQGVPQVEEARPGPSSQDVLLARETFIVNVDGKEHFIRAGVTHARRGAAVVKASPGSWVEIPVAFDVEQTTARPGEKRAR